MYNLDELLLCHCKSSSLDYFFVFLEFILLHFLDGPWLKIDDNEFDSANIGGISLSLSNNFRKLKVSMHHVMLMDVCKGSRHLQNVLENEVDIILWNCREVSKVTQVHLLDQTVHID